MGPLGWSNFGGEMGLMNMGNHRSYQGRLEDHLDYPPSPPVGYLVKGSRSNTRARRGRLSRVLAAQDGGRQMEIGGRNDRWAWSMGGGPGGWVRSGVLDNMGMGGQAGFYGGKGYGERHRR
jgi:hypothetical protein